MSAFKDAIAADVAVFLNPEEFGEPAVLVGTDGVAETTVTVVRGERLTYAIDVDSPNLPASRLELYIETANLGTAGSIGRRLVLDGCEYAIAEREDALGGISRIELERRGW